MKKRILAGVLSLMLMLGNIMMVSAEEVLEAETVQLDCESEEVATDEEVLEAETVELDYESEEVATDEEVLEADTAQPDYESEEVASDEEALEADTAQPNYESEEASAEEEYSYEEYGPTEVDSTDCLISKGAITPKTHEIVTVAEEIVSDDVVGATASTTLEEFCAFLYEQLSNNAVDINISKYAHLTAGNSKEAMCNNLSAIFFGVCNEHPDLFRVDSYAYYTTEKNGTFTSERIIAKYNGREYNQTLLDERVNEALSIIKDDMTDEQKIIALHDYLVLNCEYDKERLAAGTLQSTHPDAYNMYGVLVDRIAVCQGYAMAYEYLLSKLNITVYYVSSTTINHAWNMVEVDGKLYQIDTTWDDPTWDRFGLVSHTYMLKSDAAFGHLKEGYAKDWVVQENCKQTKTVATSTKYDDAYWKSVNSALVLHDGYYYYMAYGNRGNGSGPYIAKMPAVFADTNQQTILKNDITYWMAGTNSYWTSAYGGVYEIYGKLFYSTATDIFAMDYDTLETQSVFSVAVDGTSCMYGSMYMDGKIYYVYAAKPNEQKRQTRIEANADFSKMTYKITFYANGGTCDGKENITYVYKCGITYCLSDSYATREGYVIASWNTKADGTGVSYSPTQQITDFTSMGKTAQLYAQWRLDPNVVKIMGGYLSYNGSITMCYQVILSDELKKDSGAYLQYSDGKKVLLSSYVTKTNDEGVEYLLVTLGAAVKDITSTINVKICNSENKACSIRDESDKALESEYLTVSIEKYLTTIAASNSGYTDASRNRAQALLDYAYCADTYFDGVASKETNRLDSVTAEKMSAFMKEVAGSVEGLNYIGSSIVLENNTRYRFYFSLDEGYSISEYAFYYDYKNKTYTLKYSGSNNIYCVEIGGFTASTFCENISVRIERGSNEKMSIKYCVYSYVYDVLTMEADEDLVRLAKSMYLFGYSLSGK